VVPTAARQLADFRTPLAEEFARPHDQGPAANSSKTPLNLAMADLRRCTGSRTRKCQRCALREQAALALELAQSRYNLGLGSIVEFSQAELQKSEADIADTDAKYQYRLTQIVLAYTISSPK